MKLYMQQKGFSWDQAMPLRDKSGHTRYTVIGDAYALGKRLHIMDLAGREAVLIRQRIPSMFPRYDIEVYGKPVGSVIKDLTFLRPKYSVDGLAWEISGTTSIYDYELIWQNSVVASNHSVQGQGGELFAMEFYDRTAELSALGVMLVINCILAPQESKHPY